MQADSLVDSKGRGSSSRGVMDYLLTHTMQLPC